MSVLLHPNIIEEQFLDDKKVIQIRSYLKYKNKTIILISLKAGNKKWERILISPIYEKRGFSFFIYNSRNYTSKFDTNTFDTFDTNPVSFLVHHLQ